MAVQQCFTHGINYEVRCKLDSHANAVIQHASRLSFAYMRAMMVVNRPCDVCLQEHVRNIRYQLLTGEADHPHAELLVCYSDVSRCLQYLKMKYPPNLQSIRATLLSYRFTINAYQGLAYAGCIVCNTTGSGYNVRYDPDIFICDRCKCFGDGCVTVMCALPRVISVRDIIQCIMVMLMRLC